LGAAGVSYDKHGAAIQRSIDKTSKLAALDDEDLSDAFAKIVRSTGDVTKATEGMNLAADIAAARHISLEAATKLTEKALLGNENAFKKVGIEVEKGTTATEAFEIAQKKFAGAAEAHGKTAAGAQEKLGVAFENLQEKIGQKLLPVIAKLAIKLTEFVSWAEANWPKLAKMLQPVTDKFDEIWMVVQTMWKVIRPILEVSIPLAFKIIGTEIKIVAAVFEVLAKVVQAVVTTILKAVDKFLGGIQAIAEAASHLPLVGDKFRGVADKVGHAREKVRELATAIDNIQSKEVTVTVNTVRHEQTISSPGRGGRAAGGPVTAGQAYTVGERGRELFVPNQSGTIVPNHRMGGGGSQIIQLVVDGAVLASVVRKQDAIYARANGVPAT
jgi:hypothetical protein